MAAPGTKFPVQNFIREKELRARLGVLQGLDCEERSNTGFRKEGTRETIWSLQKELRGCLLCEDSITTGSKVEQV
jgi:hypothetical protein